MQIAWCIFYCFGFDRAEFSQWLRYGLLVHRPYLPFGRGCLCEILPQDPAIDLHDHGSGPEGIARGGFSRGWSSSLGTTELEHPIESEAWQIICRGTWWLVDCKPLLQPSVGFKAFLLLLDDDLMRFHIVLMFGSTTNQIAKARLYKPSILGWLECLLDMPLRNLPLISMLLDNVPFLGVIVLFQDTIYLLFLPSNTRGSRAFSLKPFNINSGRISLVGWCGLRYLLIWRQIHTYSLIIDPEKWYHMCLMIK